MRKFYIKVAKYNINRQKFKITLCTSYNENILSFKKKNYFIACLLYLPLLVFATVDLAPANTSPWTAGTMFAFVIRGH